MLVRGHERRTRQRRGACMAGRNEADTAAQDASGVVMAGREGAIGSSHLLV